MQSTYVVPRHESKGNSVAYYSRNIRWGVSFRPVSTNRDQMVRLLYNAKIVINRRSKCNDGNEAQHTADTVRAEAARTARLVKRIMED